MLTLNFFFSNNVEIRKNEKEVVVWMEIMELPVTMRLLDTTGRGGTLTGSFGGQLLTRSLSSSGFTGSLLGTSHDDE